MRRIRWRPLAGAVSVVFAAACADPEPVWEPAAVQVLATPGGDSPEAYFASVWPDDRRLSSGALPVESFPNPGNGALFETMRERAAQLVRGWGLSAPVYVPFSGPVDVSALSPDPAAFQREDAPVFLVSLDRSSRAYAQRVPLEWKYFAEPTLFLPGHVLAMRPPPGMPLLPATRYALVVTRRLRDGGGAPVGPDRGFFSLLHAEGDGHLRPLLDALPDLGLTREDVAGAAVFTTQAVADELLRLRAWLERQPPPVARELRAVSTSAPYRLVEGTYDAPWLLHGTPPYEVEGGELRYDAGGEPVVARVEPMRLALCTPRGAVPANGFPVVFYSHGTGGDFQSIIDPAICGLLAPAGLAVFGIDQVIHGPRALGAKACLTAPAENCFLNPVNGVAGRNLLRHAALDHVMLRRLVEGLVVPPDVDPESRTVRFDLRHFGFYGHSQGGLTGAIYASIERGLAGAVLSGAGGHLVTSLLERDGGMYAKMAAGPLFLNLGDEPLEQFHPALALVQSLAEAADPLSHAPHWVRRPLAARRSIFMTSGLEDEMTPARAAEALAAAGGLNQLTGGHTDAAVFRLAGLEPVDAPVAGNVAAADPHPEATAVLRQFPGQGHFVVWDDRTAQAQLRTFLVMLTRGQTPVVTAP